MIYLGPSDFGHKYYSTVSKISFQVSRVALTGVQIKLMLEILFTMESATALFSFVCPHVDPTQPRIILLTAYVPTANTIMLKYRAPMFKVAQPSTKPMMATIFATVMCHVRSLHFPEDQDQ
jgi:hypothetical protein